MKPIETAITLLQLARELVETEMQHRGAAYQIVMPADLQDLSDVAEDIGTVLGVLESFGGQS